MWGRFHQLRTSSSFHSEWQGFIQSSVNVMPTPQEMFTALIKATTKFTTTISTELMREEGNVQGCTHFCLFDMSGVNDSEGCRRRGW